MRRRHHPGRLFISLNNANGTFLPPYIVEAGLFLWNVSAGDFNEDGSLDLATAGQTSALLLGNGNGTFQPWQPFPFDPWSATLVAEDLDGDGHLDLSARGEAGTGVATLAILWGDGSGGFTGADYGQHPHTFSRVWLAAGDLDGDVDLDLVMDGVQDALVFVNRGGRAFDYAGRYGIGRDACAVHFAEANGDGIGDLIAIVTLDSDPSQMSNGIAVVPGLPVVTVGLESPALGASLPASVLLSPVQPNPFSERARYTLRVAEPQHVTVALYDVLGRRVRTLHDGRLGAGTVHHFELEAAGLPDGVYFLGAKGRTIGARRRAILLR